MLLLLMAIAMTSFAQNIKVSMENFDIAPGEQHEVAILVTNDVACGDGFGGDIYLPEGLKIVRNEEGDYLTRNMTRCYPTHGLTAAMKAENPNLADNQLRFSLLNLSGKTLKGNEGAVLTFTVEATSELPEDAVISLEKASIKVGTQNVEADCQANVHNTNYVKPVLALSAQDFSITPSKQVRLSFDFDTNVELSAFQADITLPDGLTFVKNEDDEYATFNWDRLTASHIPTTTKLADKNGIRLVVYSTSSKNLKGTEGEFFSITLEASEGLAEESVIKVNEVIASTSAGVKKEIASFDLKVSNPDVAAKAGLDEHVAALDVLLQQLSDALATYAESVQEVYNPKKNEAATEITGIRSALATDVAEGNVAANALTRETAIAELQTKLENLIEEAAAAQTAYEDQVAKEAANEAAYERLTAEIAKVQKALDEAKAEVETNCPDVAEQFAETIDNIQAAINAKTAEIKALYDATELTAESTVDTSAITADINKLLTDAKAAQTAYEENAAKEAANKAAYERLTAEIAEVQKALDKAKAEVAENAKDVADQFESDFDAIRKDIEALSVQVKELYDAVGLTENSSIANETGELFARIAETAERAKMAQTEYENQEAYKANEAQYVADREAIAAVTTQFEGVKRMISGYFEDVQTLVAEDIAEIEGLLEETSIMAEASHNAGTSVADAEALRNLLADIENKIEALSQKAAEAQTNHYIPGDADGDAVVDVNDFAKVKLHILESHLIEDVLRLKAADANGDGRIDVGDLTTIVDLILNPAQAAAPAAAPAVATNDGLAIVVEGEGMRQRIGIMLNAEQAYAACQMDILLPEGVTLAQETAGEMAGELTLDSNDLENGLHRILLSSMKGASMNAGNGALLWLDVNVDHSYNGEPIAVSDVLFANAKGQTFALSVAGGNTTGLSNVSMTQEVKEKIYNVGGILMDGLKRGVNIIRGNDGSSKKVIVK